MDGKELVQQTLDQILQANSNAKKIVGLVKEGGRITGYQLSDNSIVRKQQAVDMPKQGQIAGIGIAHPGDAEYLKSIPDDIANNNWQPVRRKILGLVRFRRAGRLVRLFRILVRCQMQIHPGRYISEVLSLRQGHGLVQSVWSLG